ncbi:hypothetical protein GALMADRAFT_211306 [Galerina marginata CBS 339.88]|uniref:Uncharacterized protein n=1 Tax=Galerina marginata (strain CBS 339.88) TaxID=685588 RepID=A0A067SYL1_GALM3|nr:hypothetical protein GALMADRAFT_211306 [Galerina marginata CBS 339.88]
MSSPNNRTQLEEDIAQSHLRKGKAKERDVHTESTEPPSARTSSEQLDEMAYPPVNEDAEETRRVEENLRRWEIAERQRRKAARGSTQSSNPSSLVNDVSRRASLLWSNRKTKHPSIGGIGGSHRALQSQDNIDIVPLTEIDVSPTPSPTRTDSDNPYDLDATDPFANPPEILSPFSDTDHTNTNAPPDVLQVDPDPLLKPNQLLADSPAPRPPLPKPLNLPPPRTPPPILPPPPSQDAQPSDKPGDDVRWWHDWLCGCGEGPERGGDYQAGRTNPFE